ncbi:MAG: putative Ig domain-containing protein [Verrucomicrobiota bacterium]
MVPRTGSANLPAGLALSADGTLSGTPTTAGSFSFTVRLTDSAARSVTGDLSITISP